MADDKKDPASSQLEVVAAKAATPVSQSTTSSESKPDAVEPQVVLPERDLVRIVVTTVEETIEQHFRGPVPPPELLKGYEAVVPGAAERLIQMGEREQIHRHELQKEGLRADVADAQADRRAECRGQFLAAGIAIVGLAAAALTAIVGGTAASAVAAAFIGAGGFSPMVIAFLRRGSGAEAGNAENREKKAE